MEEIQVPLGDYQPIRRLMQEQHLSRIFSSSTRRRLGFYLLDSIFFDGRLLVGSDCPLLQSLNTRGVWLRRGHQAHIEQDLSFQLRLDTEFGVL